MMAASVCWNQRFVVLVSAICLVAMGLGCSAPGGEWIELFNGKDMSGWKAQWEGNEWQAAAKVALDPKAENKRFVITPGEGIMVNGPTGKTCNIYSEVTHGDCEAHIEFVVPFGSNSGIYFMGRYEVQVLDSYGKTEVDFGDCGGIYSRWIDDKNVEGHGPKVNASKAPGEWQTFDVIFRAPRFDAAGKKIANARFEKIVHNGKVVHENVSLNGPTRSPICETEVALGPILIQGDHGPVAYRNVRIRPLK